MIHELRQNKLTLIVLVGNIGLGKTTFARTLVDSGFAIASLDSISSSMMGGESGTLHGAKYARACQLIYESTVYELLSNGISVVADELNLRESTRKYLCQLGRSFDASTMAVDFGKGTEAGLDRRANASSTFNLQGFDFMYRDFMDKYQKPTKEEGFDIIINKEAVL